MSAIPAPKNPTIAPTGADDTFSAKLKADSTTKTMVIVNTPAMIMDCWVMRDEDHDYFVIRRTNPNGSVLLRLGMEAAANLKKALETYGIR